MRLSGDLLRHWQRHAAGEGPDDGRGALFLDEPPRLLQSLLGAQGGVADNQPHVAATHATGLVYLLNRQSDHVAYFLGGFRKAAREGAEVSDRQGFLFHRRPVAAAGRQHDGRSDRQRGQDDIAKRSFHW